MKLESVEIENLRCYQELIKAKIDGLTTFIGKNDIGKSTVLEALEIFFNNDTVKITQGDANIHSGTSLVSITCEFSSLPQTLVLDSGSETSLSEEYLLTKDGNLKVKKVFDCGKKTPTCEVFIVAEHPRASGVNNLLELKEKDLQSIVKKEGIDCPLKGNPIMRKAIWSSTKELDLGIVELPVTKPKEDSKRIWEQIDKYLPLYALFQSDRSSKDSDGEVQDPMKSAIAVAISEVQDDINSIQKRVQSRTEEIANNTHEALKKIDSNLAKDLKPEFTPPTPAKWIGLFSVNLTTDGIPLNKRGSGVRRLILVSFFKAEAERLLTKGNKKSIIYAIEEPETSQHPNNQKILQQSFMELANEVNCQVILTTHSPGFASDLPMEGIRYITINENSKHEIQSGVDVLNEVAEALGITPDSRVKALVCVEGPTDVNALKELSKILHFENNSLPNLATDDRVAFIVLGGGNLKHWVNNNYLKGLGKPEFHIYDADVPSYSESANEVNQRGDGSKGFITLKHEIESYLHTDAIKVAFGVEIEVTDHPNEEGEATPKVFAKAYSSLKGFDGVMGDSKAKMKLSDKAFSEMTVEMIKERDPNGEIEGWLRVIGEAVS
ncbi:ATP-binding protein [methanotrophic endosymbiont of Bathymodiolus puteoserpentis (Logatchev)]|jgi:AAA15 family ATPase/GTPase|uniref:ATP-binding protein n=1 Tax=methanotrophic endosymbiont of Bathymodiolus puteoserpentis (Logatchev) TaxID=343235 RepID=UPI00157B9B0B|nr:ATP-binding protein [methanotrophic endosymbiont of Bathymodiolus puteoserpentis (Logatchev)]